MTDTISLRTADPDDYDALGELMFDAIHNGPTEYTKAQSQAWAPAPYSGSDWATRLDGKQVFVAEQDRTLLGFMTIEPGGYIDFAYIRPTAQGSGLFRRLFEAVERKAVAAGDQELTTHASLMAQPAFAAMGFEIVLHELVPVDGQWLKRASMKRAL